MLRILILFLSFNLLSDVNKFIDASSKKYDQLALDLWDYAEMGYQEVKSSNALKKVLKEEGFSIREFLVKLNVRRRRGDINKTDYTETKRRILLMILMVRKLN